MEGGGHHPAVFADLIRSGLAQRGPVRPYPADTPPVLPCEPSLFFTAIRPPSDGGRPVPKMHTGPRNGPWKQI